MNLDDTDLHTLYNTPTTLTRGKKRKHLKNEECFTLATPNESSVKVCTCVYVSELVISDMLCLFYVI